MFEIGDKIRFREWANQPWSNEVWEIFEINLDFEFYDSTFYSYTIMNSVTGEYKFNVNWQQIEVI